ncbi:3-methyladenine DNA glycosylase [Demequina sp. B12]|uniref:3-methyladenine DNA glycosylase n=1 Tax=Demequina sp. B12 TaxID=2992757 RepID=UPI00237A3D7A|nr:3-methyladenine DNA glycosylase [Demequina sp. B12]MDE0572732.1 3-methyladenine DNA glycosylase [Demequina sp. B12]
MSVASPTRILLSRDDWTTAASAHEARADTLTAGRRERAARGESHAIEDFLYDYYSTKPAQLRRWHPGIDVALDRADAHAGWRWYTTSGGVTTIDVAGFVADRGEGVRHIRRLLAATAGRAPMLGCFGMHEWAMVYRAADAERRHGLPLRLGAAGTDAVVDAHPLRCTHIDAFRFFTAPAAPLNAHQLTRAGQVEMDQPGCLHATMDLYKWAMKLGPAAPGDLLLDCFELALDVRRVDMQASPYDVSSYGLEAIPVETPAGKSEYASRQRAFARRAAPLRERLIEICDAVLDAG